MYRLPNIQLTLMVINLRMRFEKIAFLLKRIVPLGKQENIGAIYNFAMFSQK